MKASNFIERTMTTAICMMSDSPIAHRRTLFRSASAVGTARGRVLKSHASVGTSVMTMRDVEELGTQKAAEMALELAWKDAKAVYLSFDIDSIDPGFAPGTGTPEPGGFLPREALEMARLIAREGLCAMEVVEVSPPYDVNDNTSQLACRVILDVLGTLVVEGKLGHRDRVVQPE